jgi:hypothetical protein
MAIIFHGQSECPVCHMILYQEQDIALFPAFISNTKDPLYIFNDEGIHRFCLEKHPLGNKVSEFLEKVTFKSRPENRICDIGGNFIDSPENYLFISLLTSDEAERLYAFNFMNIDLQNITKWKDKENFIPAAELFLQAEKWESLTSFNYLEYVLEKIKSRLEAGFIFKV